MYKNGKLTVEGMAQVIKSGGSVLHQGKIIHRVEDLPSTVDLATDETSVANAELELEMQEKELAAKREALNARKAKLESGQPIEESKSADEEEPEEKEEDTDAEEEEVFGEEEIPLSAFKGKSVDEILEEGHKGIGKRTAERIVKLLED